MAFDHQHDYARRSQRGLWGWLRRRELRAVAAVSPPLGGLRIWEACAGAGYYTSWMAAQGAREIVAVDRSPTMLAQIEPGPIRLVCTEISNFRETGFDLVACLGGLEFLPDAAAFFTQAGASGASQLLLLVPRDNLWGKLYRLYHALNGQAIYLRSLAELDEAALGWRRLVWRRAGPYSLALVYQRS